MPYEIASKGYTELTIEIRTVWATESIGCCRRALLTISSQAQENSEESEILARRAAVPDRPFDPIQASP